MALTKWNPELSIAPMAELLPRFSQLRQELDRLMDSFFGGGISRMLRGELAGTDFSGFWMPAIDIYEQDDAYIVKAELPGVKKENVNITIHENVLTIRGERSEERTDKKAQYFRKERNVGSFMRSFTLPSSVKTDKIEAVYSDGVLTITLPKAEEAKPKAIPVKVG